jgi:hypothetical protein
MSIPIELKSSSNSIFEVDNTKLALPGELPFLMIDFTANGVTSAVKVQFRPGGETVGQV